MRGRRRTVRTLRAIGPAQFPLPTSTLGGYAPAVFVLPTATGYGIPMMPAPATLAPAANGAVPVNGANWMQQQSIISGYENWKVLAAGAGLFLLLRPLWGTP